MFPAVCAQGHVNNRQCDLVPSRAASHGTQREPSCLEESLFGEFSFSFHVDLRVVLAYRLQLALVLQEIG